MNFSSISYKRQRSKDGNKDPRLNIMSRWLDGANATALADSYEESGMKTSTEFQSAAEFHKPSHDVARQAALSSDGNALRRCRRWVVIDTETTGGVNGHLIEIAAVEIIDRLVTGRQYHSFFNPQTNDKKDMSNQAPTADVDCRSLIGNSTSAANYRVDIDEGLCKPSNIQINPYAAKVHGISDIGTLAGKPYFRDVSSFFLSFLAAADAPYWPGSPFTEPSDGLAIIAHNAVFDVTVINRALAQTEKKNSLDAVGIPSLGLALSVSHILQMNSQSIMNRGSVTEHDHKNDPKTNAVEKESSLSDPEKCRPQVHIVCTQKLFRSLFPGQPSGLDMALSFCGLKARKEGAFHSAITDAGLTADLALFLAQHLCL